MPDQNLRKIINLECTPTEIDIAQLICRRFGDGFVYIPSGEGLQILGQAMNCGYVNEEGYITSKGRKLINKSRLY